MSIFIICLIGIGFFQTTYFQYSPGPSNSFVTIQTWWILPRSDRKGELSWTWLTIERHIYCIEFGAGGNATRFLLISGWWDLLVVLLIAVVFYSWSQIRILMDPYSVQLLYPDPYSEYGSEMFRLHNNYTTFWNFSPLFLLVYKTFFCRIFVNSNSEPRYVHTCLQYYLLMTLSAICP